MIWDNWVDGGEVYFLCTQTSMPKGREGVFLTFVGSLNTSQGSVQHQSLPSRSSRLVGKVPRIGEGVLTLREGAP